MYEFSEPPLPPLPSFKHIQFISLFTEARWVQLSILDGIPKLSPQYCQRLPFMKALGLLPGYILPSSLPPFANEIFGVWAKVSAFQRERLAEYANVASRNVGLERESAIISIHSTFFQDLRVGVLVIDGKLNPGSTSIFKEPSVSLTLMPGISPTGAELSLWSTSHSFLHIFGFLFLPVKGSLYRFQAEINPVKIKSMMILCVLVVAI
ncbi:hypothetical protein EDC01DRAFT_168077 [Geopyxis carbonaria]|nr:hypothetical protein EDC01DRAFT_168077 [Geopyxis carbonaria]